MAKRLNQTKIYQKEIKRIAKIIEKKYQPNKIILFGSAVSGKFNSDSDIDLLIVKNTQLKRTERIRQVSDLFLERRIPLDPMVLTETEFSSALNNNPVIKNIIRSGRILYDRSRIKTD